MVTYNINRPWETLDPWQKEYIETIDSDCWILKGRQGGGSTAMSIKVVELALAKETALTGKGEYMISGFTEDQGFIIFSKALIYLQARYPHMIDMSAKKKPSAHDIWLKNGSHIFLKALGLMGAGARGQTPKRIFVDEAQLCLRQVFVALQPSLSVSGGKMDICGTPDGKQGFYYECSDEPELAGKIKTNFKRWRVSAEDCPRQSKESLEIAKQMLTAEEYAQEYLCQFLDDIRRLFPEEIIKERCILEKENGVPQGFKYYLGVDIARLGNDLTSFQVIRKIDKDHYEHVYSETARKKLTTWTENRIIELNEIYNFAKIGIDAGSGSLGVGIYDHLINEPKLVNKVVALNSREVVSRIDETKGKVKILNEDGYMNLLWGMQKKNLTLLKDDETAASLASVQWENIVSPGKRTTTRIYGKYTHSAEALWRAFWEASHDNSLSIWAR